MNETTPPIMTINDELLAELEAAANAATPGPWNYDGSYVCTMRQEDGTVYVESWNPIADALLTKNVHYIARANPATILALLQHVRELKADNLRMRLALDRLSRTPGCGCSFPCRCGGDEWTKAELEGRIDIAIDALSPRNSAD